MMEDRTLRVLRTQAWERAKGELRSMLHTYNDWDEYGNQIIDNYYDQFSIALDKFIQQVEDNDWQE
jgi:hypothetical protein